MTDHSWELELTMPVLQKEQLKAVGWDTEMQVKIGYWNADILSFWGNQRKHSHSFKSHLQCLLPCGQVGPTIRHVKCAPEH